MYNVYRIDQLGRLNYWGRFTPAQLIERGEPACRPAFTHQDFLDILIFPIPRTFPV